MPSYISRPNADVSAGWTENPAGAAYTCVDEAVLAPTVPDTTDYLSTSTNGAVTSFQFEPVSIPAGERVVEIKFWCYYRSGASGAVGISGLDVSGAVLPGAGNFLTSTSYVWDSVSYDGNLSSYQLDNIFLQFTQSGTNESRIAGVYVEFVTEHTAEQITLDPAEVSSGRTELDLTAGPIQVAYEGIDWGDAAVEAYLADQRYGSAAIDYRVANREIVIPLILTEDYDLSFAAARGMLQQKVGVIQAEGQGWLKRVTANGGVIYADLVGATLRLPGSWEQAHKKRSIDAQLVLTALPDFYGDEIQLGDHVETSAAELIFTETDLKGDGPARVRVVVDEDQGKDQKSLIWSFRSRHYSDSNRAQYAFEAEALTAQDTAASAVALGASGGSAMAHTALTTSWTPVLSNYVAGIGYMTHEGTYRCFARVLSGNGSAVSLRMVYDVGDLTNPTENDPWQIPAPNGWYIADLGDLQLHKLPLGQHLWAGQIQAIGTAGGENVYIDRLWIVNVDDGMGVLRASSDNEDITFTSFAARDEFNQSAGAVTGKTLPVGGTWSGSGGATDFAMDATNHRITRTSVSETFPTGGRFIRASGSSGTVQRGQVDCMHDTAVSGFGTDYQGVLLRYVDTSNWLGIFRVVSYAGVFGPAVLNGQLWVVKNVAGVQTTLAQIDGSVWAGAVSVWFRVSGFVDATGRWTASLGAPTSPNLWNLSGQDNDLATGGALASGTAGIFDCHTVAGACTRSYDNFAAAIPNPDAVLFSKQSAQLTSEGMYRLDSGGAAYGPVSIVDHDLPRLPPPGMEGRPLEVFIKASRGDMGSIPDSGIDDISARVFYRPSWLFAASINADRIGPL